MKTYFSSDLHFCHANIIKFSGRPFEDVPDMNERLVERWNSTVGDDDTVWVLGDVAMGQIAESLELCSRLNGNKILLCGNHDRAWAGYQEHRPGKKHNWAKRYVDEGGFQTVLDGRTHPMIELVGDEGSVTVQLSHFPHTGDHTVEERYKNWRPTDDGEWLVHGHVHEMWRVDQKNRQINVGVDVWNFAPVSEATLADIILGTET